MKRLAALATLLLAGPVRAQLLDAKTYAGCYSDAHVQTCLTVPYTLTFFTSSTNHVQGGPVSFSFLNLATNTSFVPIFQSFPLFYISGLDGYIGFGGTFPFDFETLRTSQSTLPNGITLRFAESVGCAFNSTTNPCGATQDPAFSKLASPFVTDISVPLTAVPEPAPLTLVAIGLALVACIVYRKVT